MGGKKDMLSSPTSTEVSTMPGFTLAFLLIATLFHGSALAAECVGCHEKKTPQIVSDWRESRHSRNDVGCPTCHGDAHQAADDFAKAKIPTPATCIECHDGQVQQYMKGKHAIAWQAMKDLPATHWQPMALTEGMKGCGGCHKIGLKKEDDVRELQKQGRGFGLASCDACHTRHLFSKKEASQPQACQTCHMGFDHPQWEMYSSSKHGVRYLLKQNGILPATAAAPKCQTCHMPEGNHEVRTAWGFLAVRLPMPADNDWATDRVTILQALGVLGPDGKPTKRLELVKTLDMARTTQEEWQKERDRMISICNGCHAANFSRGELEKGDRMIREADRLMAEAIRTVGDLYREGILPKPKEYASAFPDLLQFHDAPTSVEQKLFVMFLEHRMRAFQGAFHANPDYAFWYGWSEMRRDLTEIREMAEKMRAARGKR